MYAKGYSIKKGGEGGGDRKHFRPLPSHEAEAKVFKTTKLKLKSKLWPQIRIIASVGLS